ncbi:hypothetical protein E2C01_066354 [Portunus trituberculatus]|uniref:Uncharacterized protein n=1 Tax=Portunus trituberculatus TaxID=210409 RepID=A0A5B7HGV2_PORTR|nr:hypothetical protein [Portunus trituberculatus]
MVVVVHMDAFPRGGGSSSSVCGHTGGLPGVVVVVVAASCPVPESLITNVTPHTARHSVGGPRHSLTSWPAHPTLARLGPECGMQTGAT